MFKPILEIAKNSLPIQSKNAFKRFFKMLVFYSYVDNNLANSSNGMIGIFRFDVWQLQKFSYSHDSITRLRFS